ncbi:MAG: alpha-L-fucosidase [Puniceicoccales bacterium]|nr:alpha-L-fucosidase [Puniceicoccales bacterium]
MNSPACLLSALAALTLLPFAGAADKITPPPSEETTAQRDARMKWWREARFGMFIHYGLYSGLEGEWEGKSIGGGGVEWIQSRKGIPGDAYRKEAFPKFKPRKGVTKEWAQLAKETGCKYVVLTSKHHEGYALFDSKLTDYDSVDTNGFDIVKEYAEAVRSAGLRVGYYHSVIDWHHPQYDFRKAKGLPYPSGEAKAAGDTPRDHDKYIEFLHGQTKELLSNYGKVDIIWWDYSSTQFDGEEAWKSIELMKMVREKQPEIISNNRLYRRPEAGFKGMGTSAVTTMLDPRYADFITPEQHIPADGTPGLDWETCMTMNGTWGWSKYDTKWKSTQQLVRNLCDIVSKGGNYLLNIGPMPDGSIPPESIERMKGIGKWMDVNGDAIYGTTASPLAKAPDWGRITTKGNRVYLHIFETPKDGTVTVALNNEVKNAFALSADGKKIAVTKSAEGLSFPAPAATGDGLPVVVALDLTAAPASLK